MHERIVGILRQRLHERRFRPRGFLQCREYLRLQHVGLGSLRPQILQEKRLGVGCMGLVKLLLRERAVKVEKLSSGRHALHVRAKVAVVGVAVLKLDGLVQELGGHFGIVLSRIDILGHLRVACGHRPNFIPAMCPGNEIPHAADEGNERYALQNRHHDKALKALEPRLLHFGDEMVANLLQIFGLEANRFGICRDALCVFRYSLVLRIVMLLGHVVPHFRTVAA